MIHAGTITREEALKILEQPPYDEEQGKLDLEYIAKKLGVTTKEFEDIIARPNRIPQDYKNQMWLMKLSVWISRKLGIENRNIR